MDSFCNDLVFKDTLVFRIDVLRIAYTCSSLALGLPACGDTPSSHIAICSFLLLDHSRFCVGCAGGLRCYDYDI
jgi:hypothetical protein